jgi:hypothetical protein
MVGTGGLTKYRPRGRQGKQQKWRGGRRKAGQGNPRDRWETVGPRWKGKSGSTWPRVSVGGGCRAKGSWRGGGVRSRPPRTGGAARGR